MVRDRGLDFINMPLYSSPYLHNYMKKHFLKYAAALYSIGVPHF